MSYQSYERRLHNAKNKVQLLFVLLDLYNLKCIQVPFKNSFLIVDKNMVSVGKIVIDRKLRVRLFIKKVASPEQRRILKECRKKV